MKFGLFIVATIVALNNEEAKAANYIRGGVAKPQQQQLHRNDEVLDIQTTEGDGGNIDIQIYTNKEGNEVVQITSSSSTSSNNNNNNNVIQDVDGAVGGCFENVSSDDCSSADGHMVGDYCCGAREISVSSGDSTGDISSIPSVNSGDVLGGCFENVSSDDCSSADGHMVGDYCCGAREISFSSGDIPSIPSVSSGDFSSPIQHSQQTFGGNNNNNVVASAHKKVVQQNHHRQNNNN